MKKYLFVAVAALLAVALTAFTSLQSTTLYYWDGNSMEEYQGSHGCTPGIVSPCEVSIPGVGDDVRLYTIPEQDDNFLFKKNS